ncbi:plasmid maintenance toxin (PemK-like) [Mesorhizobium sp. WSM3224]|uniref:plasmid maintenance toxin (PemK-like) n=1 Tax=Mesorhizobium sp. WSM3224 TaxID=1040986 RepID=UPI00040B6A42|nr:plasmid maintenance toxin (PemK-like) [Mesorhizobium sp. WSM3224]
MLPAEIKVGHVFRYSYLWHWQHREGREEGDKDRPGLVLALVAMQEDGSPVVRVLPITHTPPSDPANAIEIPAAVKLRLRLDGERSWIILTESNRFAWPGPDIRPLDTESGYYGPLPPALFAAVKRRFVAIATSHAHRSTPRSALIGADQRSIGEEALDLRRQLGRRGRR